MPPIRTAIIDTKGCILDHPFQYTRDALKSESRPAAPAVRATAVQTYELNKAFQETDRPTREVKDSLATRLGLTVAWISGWFIRQRKKRRTAQQKLETSQSEALQSIPNPRPPEHMNVLTSPSTRVTLAPNATNHPSISSALTLPPSLPTDSRPVFGQTYIQTYTTINNMPLWNALPQSSASTSTIDSESLVSATSTSMFRHPMTGYSSGSQLTKNDFPPDVPHTSHFYQPHPIRIPLANEVPSQPISFYAPARANPSLSAAAASNRKNIPKDELHLMLRQCALPLGGVDLKNEIHAPRPRKADLALYANVLASTESDEDSAPVEFAQSEGDAGEETLRCSENHAPKLDSLRSPHSTAPPTSGDDSGAGGETQGPGTSDPPGGKTSTHDVDILPASVTSEGSSPAGEAETAAMALNSQNEAETTLSPVSKTGTTSSSGSAASTALDLRPGPMNGEEKERKTEKFSEVETLLTDGFKPTETVSMRRGSAISCSLNGERVG